MLIHELIEAALMSTEDQQAFSVQKLLVGSLLKNYEEHLRRLQLSTSSVLFTPKSAEVSASAGSIIGLRNTFFTTAQPMNPSTLIHSRCLSPAYKSFQSDLTSILGSDLDDSAFGRPHRAALEARSIVTKGGLNETYSDSLASECGRYSTSTMENGRICEA
jgi:hypothetical protein